VNEEQISNTYRERAIIIRIGLDKNDGQWCEEISINDCRRLPDRKLFGNVVEEHNNVFDRYGKVLFGRFEVLCHRWQNAMHNFLNASCPRFGGKFMLILRKGKTYEGYATRVFQFAHVCHDSGLVPSYYQDLTPAMFTWFEIGELQPINSKDLVKYIKDLSYAVKRKRLISKTLADAGY
tara:strand:- start:16 stop:552 length:537 start_codon:yes stop_codon:yes gene_type:complete